MNDSAKSSGRRVDERLITSTASVQVACESLLAGVRKDGYDAKALLERTECVTQLPNDYVQALQNRPIPDTSIVSYDAKIAGTTYPARHFFYGVAEAHQSRDGCEVFADTYRQISTNVQCIIGYD